MPFAANVTVALVIVIVAPLDGMPEALKTELNQMESPPAPIGVRLKFDWIEEITFLTFMPGGGAPAIEPPRELPAEELPAPGAGAPTLLALTLVDDPMPPPPL